MNKLSDDVMRRIKKILALAERGVDGEKAAAEAMLAKMLLKYGLTLEDVSQNDAKRAWVELTYSGENERILLAQIVRKVTGKNEIMVRSVKRVRTKCSYELTPAEHIEVEFMFAILQIALHAEMTKLLTAFIHKNKLYAPSLDDSEETHDEQKTPEERARIRQIAMMMNGMSPVTIHKAITVN
ncbi:MAG: DUF2786 domain-containing protein [bacterium]|nr:DUF2786 domain-containing protein [bacterium]